MEHIQTINWAAGALLLGVSVFFGLWSVYLIVCTDGRRVITLAVVHILLLIVTVVSAFGNT